MRQQRSPEEKAADAAERKRFQDQVKEQMLRDIVLLVLDDKDLSGDLSGKVAKWAAKQGVDMFEAIRRLVELGLKAKGK